VADQIAQVPAAPPSPPAPTAPPAGAEAPASVSGDAGPATGAEGEVPAPGQVIVNGVVIPTGAPYPSGAPGVQINGLPDIPPNIYSLGQNAIIGLTMVLLAFPVFGFLKALLNRRGATAQAALPRDTTERLARIEAAVEAMSVEVERISEGQRFVTKVLAERSTVVR
jgi:hypothetical protein